MKKYRLWSFALLTFLLVSISQPAVAAQEGQTTAPRLNAGKKWRIGYLEGGSYYFYSQFLRSILSGLMELGWMEQMELPPMNETGDIEPLWDWLSREARSSYLEFPRDAFWSVKWDKEARMAVKASILERMKSRHDIDVMLAMGTWAGQDLATAEHSTPVFVLGTNDPVASKIVASETDSGLDHVHAWLDPKRYERQIRLFHDCVRFKRLGVAYEDTVSGRSYAALKAIEQVAGERNFEVVQCHFLMDTDDIRKSNEELAACFRKMAPSIDALYLGPNNVKLKELHEFMAPLLERKVAIFSKQYEDVLHGGALLGISRSSFKFIGLFEATAIARTLNGSRPRDLPQAFEEPSKIVINMEVAKEIGYVPEDWVINITDEFYSQVKKGN